MTSWYYLDALILYSKNRNAESTDLFLDLIYIESSSLVESSLVESSLIESSLVKAALVESALVESALVESAQSSRQIYF